MKHATQVNLIHQIFDAIDRGTPPMAERFTRNDTSAYTSSERAARERDVLFRHHPIVAGFSSQIPNPGDYLTEDLAPVPIMVVRNTSGETDWKTRSGGICEAMPGLPSATMMSQS